MLTKHYKKPNRNSSTRTYTQWIRSNKRSCFGFLNVFVATQLQKGLFTCILFVKTICTCVVVCMRACVRVCILKRANGQNLYIYINVKTTRSIHLHKLQNIRMALYAFPHVYLMRCLFVPFAMHRCMWESSCFYFTFVTTQRIVSSLKGMMKTIQKPPI